MRSGSKTAAAKRTDAVAAAISFFFTARFFTFFSAAAFFLFQAAGFRTAAHARSRHYRLNGKQADNKKQYGRKYAHLQSKGTE